MESLILDELERYIETSKKTESALTKNLELV